MRNYRGTWPHHTHFPAQKETPHQRRGGKQDKRELNNNPLPSGLKGLFIGAAHRKLPRLGANTWLICRLRLGDA
jgi:hypothetical protein